MLDKPASSVTSSDITALLQNDQREDQRLDYKEAFPVKTEDMQSFLRHVVGMANTSGGYILIGIAESRDTSGKQTGLPGYISGLPAANIDAECLRIQCAIRDSVKPALVPFPEFQSVSTDQGQVMVVRIRRSFTRPHMLGHRFYARQGAQTNPLEVEQVRAEFLESEALPNRVREFRATALADILAGERSRILRAPANLVVHVCPLESFSGSRSVDIVALYNQHVMPLGLEGGGYTCRLNFEGLVSYSGDYGSASSYAQIFRNGCIEFATCRMLAAPDAPRTFPLFRLVEASKLLLVSLPNHLRILSTVATYPLVLAVSILGTQGARALIDTYACDPTRDAQEDRALFDLYLAEQPADWDLALRPVLDAIWQGFGIPSCASLYNSDGRLQP